MKMQVAHMAGAICPRRGWRHPAAMFTFLILLFQTTFLANSGKAATLKIIKSVSCSHQKCLEVTAQDAEESMTHSALSTELAQIRIVDLTTGRVFLTVKSKDAFIDFKTGHAFLREIEDRAYSEVFYDIKAGTLQYFAKLKFEKK